MKPCKLKKNEIEQIAMHYFDTFNESPKGVKVWDEIDAMINEGESREDCIALLKTEMSSFLADEWAGVPSKGINVSLIRAKIEELIGVFVVNR